MRGGERHLGRQRLLEVRYEEVKRLWEERFEARYGFWCGFVDTAVARYLDCGILETVSELMTASVSTANHIRPGFIAVIQTFNSDLRFNPHIHAIASRGAWDEEHNWIPLPYLDARSAELLFRHKVLAFLRDRQLIDDARIALPSCAKTRPMALAGERRQLKATWRRTWPSRCRHDS